MLLMIASSVKTLLSILGGIAVVGGGAYITYTILKVKVHPPVSEPDIKDEIKPIIKYFNGSMGALSIIKEDPNDSGRSEVFKTLEQIISVHGSDKLKSWLSDFTKDREQWTTAEYKAKATKLLDLLRQCGISSSNETEITWASDSSEKYRKFSKIEIGQKCVVLAPYWIYQGKVFELGLVKVK